MERKQVINKLKARASKLVADHNECSKLVCEPSSERVIGCSSNNMQLCTVYEAQLEELKYVANNIMGVKLEIVRTKGTDDVKLLGYKIYDSVQMPVYAISCSQYLDGVLMACSIVADTTSTDITKVADKLEKYTNTQGKHYSIIKVGVDTVKDCVVAEG